MRNRHAHSSHGLNQRVLIALAMLFAISAKAQAQAPQTHITNRTITNNRVDNDTQNSGNAGGLFIFGATTLTLRNSIFDLNFVDSSPSTTASDILGAVIAAPLASD